jgi:hypothetical protein
MNKSEVLKAIEKQLDETGPANGNFEFIFVVSENTVGKLTSIGDSPPSARHMEMLKFVVTDIADQCIEKCLYKGAKR